MRRKRPEDELTLSVNKQKIRIVSRRPKKKKIKMRRGENSFKEGMVSSEGMLWRDLIRRGRG